MIQFVPFSFLVGGQLTPWKGHFTITKRSRIKSPGICLYITQLEEPPNHSNKGASTNLCGFPQPILIWLIEIQCRILFNLNWNSEFFYGWSTGAPQPTPLRNKDLIASHKGKVISQMRLYGLQYLDTYISPVFHVTIFHGNSHGTQKKVRIAELPGSRIL